MFHAVKKKLINTKKELNEKLHMSKTTLIRLSTSLEASPVGLENINGYYQYTVITKIEYVNENQMKLPAITICLFSLQSSTLGDFLYECSINVAVCEFNDFYSFTM